MDNFDLRKFLTENKLTSVTRISEQEDQMYTVVGLATTRTSDVEDALSTGTYEVVRATSPEDAMIKYLETHAKMTPEDAEDFMSTELPDKDSVGDVNVYEGYDEKYFVKPGSHDISELKPEIYQSFGETFRGEDHPEDDYSSYKGI